MEYIKIKIDTDYKDYTDELEDLTYDLINEIEELYIEEVQIPKRDKIEGSKGIDIVEFGNIIIPIILSPAVIIALVKVLNTWVLAKKEVSIVKKVIFYYDGKKHEIHGCSKEEITKIIQEIKK
jgi:hypothetical protein